MKILIETPRLIMREFTLDDIDAVFEFSSDEEVSRYTGDPVSTCREDAEKIIRDIWLKEYKQYGYARYALIHKADNKLIGFCGIKFEPKDNAPDIGYRMLKQYWGQGLGYEAAKAALDYARNILGLNNIFADAVVENTASIKIIEKLGFKFEKQFESQGFLVNRYR